MLPFVLKRLALAVPTLIAVSLIVFVVARLAPSGPVAILLGDKATTEQITRMNHLFGLDKPVAVQYAYYLRNIVLHADFGRAITRNIRISDMIKSDFPVTAQLAIQALLFAMAFGLPLGALAALYHNSWLDRVAMLFVVMMVSVPSIVLGPVMMLVLGVKLRWLPVSGWDSPACTIMPMIALGSRSAALLARFMRASLLDVLKQDYIRTAIAKGLPKYKVVLKHGLKNAFLPVLTVLGTNFGALLTGSFVVETLFVVPGIGHESIDSITRRDYPVIQGMSLLVAVIFILVNLGVDILYGFVDPRVRTQEEA